MIAQTIERQLSFGESITKARAGNSLVTKITKPFMFISACIVMCLNLYACKSLFLHKVKCGEHSALLFRLGGVDEVRNIELPAYGNFHVGISNLDTRAKFDTVLGGNCFLTNLPRGWVCRIVPRGTNYIQISHFSFSRLIENVWRVDIPRDAELVYVGTIRFQKCHKLAFLEKPPFKYDCQDPLVLNEEGSARKFAEEFFPELSDLEISIMQVHNDSQLYFK